MWGSLNGGQQAYEIRRRDVNRQRSDYERQRTRPVPPTRKGRVVSVVSRTPSRPTTSRRDDFAARRTHGVPLTCAHARKHPLPGDFAAQRLSSFRDVFRSLADSPRPLGLSSSPSQGATRSRQSGNARWSHTAVRSSVQEMNAAMARSSPDPADTPTTAGSITGPRHTLVV